MPQPIVTQRVLFFPATRPACERRGRAAMITEVCADGTVSLAVWLPNGSPVLWPPQNVPFIPSGAHVPDGDYCTPVPGDVTWADWAEAMLRERAAAKQSPE